MGSYCVPIPSSCIICGPLDNQSSGGLNVVVILLDADSQID